MIFRSARDYEASGFRPRVCILGSGPAGITIARTLAKMGVPVTVLEAGSDEITAESQAFYEGETIGDTYFPLDVARLRYLGGCSNHWAGWCRVLDASDFLPRAWIPGSGWPIRRADIDPFLGEVHDILDLPPFADDREITEDLHWIQLIKSPAVRFGEKYRVDLQRDPRIALVLNTYASELLGDGTAVTGARVVSQGEPAADIEAVSFVLCTGGLENSRLLLWSHERSGGAVVPRAKALGRYWMEHPQFIAASVVMNDVQTIEFDAAGEAFFSPSPQAMERLSIGNFGARLIPMPYQGLKKRLADLACVAPATAEWLARRASVHLNCGAYVSMGWEQAPDAENRVALSAGERDAAGVPRIELHWKKTEIDHRTLLEGLRLFGRSIAAAEIGRLRIDDWVEGRAYPDDGELAGYHHMGGTRMGTDPATSVVDADCRVHGMRNLFVGGSSVFPTSGEANPTTTIVALALRLGYHLAAMPDHTA
ncbi:GMC family oxidoreductase [Aurantimonas sp. Leaf443]|uniref:GMC oxidoreductase n=1 Tax=Aurantimonas sp. Leaf443 TaxID=1736378 RepID=UPI0006FCA100|nr:GMC family oxidoreductase [Aurantimonas sp. Leaf443]KQT87526.1 dehydrogenase [Aurantimonas sp. Leaf443]